MEGMNEDYILKAIFKLRTENTEVHDRIIEYFTNQRFTAHSTSASVGTPSSTTDNSIEKYD